MLKSLLVFLGIMDPPRKQGKGSIRYAHPSHAPNSNKKMRQDSFTSSHVKNSTSSAYEQRSFYKKGVNIPSVDQIFPKYEEQVRRLTLSFLSQKGKDGASYKEIDEYIFGKIIKSRDVAFSCASQADYKEKMRDIRNEMRRERRISYDTDRNIWQFNSDVPVRALTPNEEMFLSRRGLGKGWVNIPNEMDAISWIHKEFSPTPEKFEHFCASILTTHCNVPVKITEKRPSGADGGFDLIGEMIIEGELRPVVVEAKCWNPQAQVGTDVLYKFRGAMDLHNIRHGFIITTANFSANLLKDAALFKGVEFELIAQERLAKIMLTRTTEPHGFGLHKTDAEMVYMNEDILRKAGEAA